MALDNVEVKLQQWAANAEDDDYLSLDDSSQFDLGIVRGRENVPEPSRIRGRENVPEAYRPKAKEKIPNPICVRARQVVRDQSVEKKSSSSLRKFSRAIAKIRKAKGEKNAIIEIYRQARQCTDYIRMEGELYAREATCYKKIVKNEIWKHLLSVLPNDMQSMILAENEWRLHSAFLSLPYIQEIERSKVAEKYSDYIALENCIIDIRNLRILPPSEKAICLHKIRANYEDKYYEEPLAWDQFISDCAGGDEELIARIEDVVAIILATGKKVKKFFYLGTAPDSGKSTLADFIFELFEPGVVGRMDLHDFSGKFALGSLADYSVNISMDLTSQSIPPKAVSNVKIVTGDRQIQAEKKYKQSAPQTIMCKLVFGSNFPLKLVENDQAFWNRVEVIPFSYSVPPERQDPSLFSALLSEKDKIVSKLIRRLPKLLERNMELTFSEKAESVKESWMRDSRGMTENFVADKCLVTNNPLDYVPSGELYKAYEEFAKKKGKTPEASNVFTRKVRELIADECSQYPRTIREPGKKETVNIVRGIRMKGGEEYGD